MKNREADAAIREFDFGKSHQFRSQSSPPVPRFDEKVEYISALETGRMKMMQRPIDQQESNSSDRTTFIECEKPEVAAIPQLRSQLGPKMRPHRAQDFLHDAGITEHFFTVSTD